MTAGRPAKTVPRAAARLDNDKSDKGTKIEVNHKETG